MKTHLSFSLLLCFSIVLFAHLPHQFSTLQESHHIYRCIKRDENALKKLGVSQQHALEAKATNNIQGYINKTATSLSKEVIISLYLAFVRQSLGYRILFSALRDKKDMDKLKLD